MASIEVVATKGTAVKGMFMECKNTIKSLYDMKQCYLCKVHIFWEGHKILRNLPLTFDCMYCSQKLVEDFARFLWPSQNIWTLRNHITHKLCYENFCRPKIVTVTSLKGILDYRLTKQYMIERYDCPYISTPIHEIWVFVSSDWLIILFSKRYFCKTLLFTESRTTYIFDREVFLLACELWILKSCFFCLMTKN